VEDEETKEGADNDAEDDWEKLNVGEVSDIRFFSLLFS